MRILELTALPNGAHRNQTLYGSMTVPEGWAKIPDGMALPNFPFGEVQAEKIDGILTVTTWTAGTIPKPEPEQSEPDPQEDTDALLVDHEYRITLLELGVI